MRLPAVVALAASLLAAPAPVPGDGPRSADLSDPGPPARQEAFDVLLRGGRVLDGMGNPWIRADVALRGDRIAAVGRLDGATAREVIDASGLWIAPGFVDTHSHSGEGLATEGLRDARPLLAQGVTTVFVNPDGGGPVDIAAQRDSLERGGIGVNAAPFISHGSVRREVLGMDDRAPSPGEMERMKALVRTAMEEGAWGLSSGTFYAPGSFSEPAELVELARVVAPYGGAYQSHIRDEADYSVGLLASVDEVISVARGAGIPGVVTHVKALGPNVWGFSAAIVHRIERAREAGVEVYTDQYPYLASATGLSAALLPRWAQAGGADSLEARFRRPRTLDSIRVEVTENLARRAGAERIQFRRFRQDPSIEGKTLAQVAGERGKSAVETALELIRQGGPSIVSHNMHENDLRTLMVQPWTMTASDGGLVPMGEGVPHPRSYGTFPRKIQLYALEQGVVTLEHAIRSMTSLPARVYRVPDRGELRPGALADVVVFDLARVRELATFTEPHQLAEGMVHVFVNGRAAVRDGRFTGERAGRVLRRDR